MWNEFILYMGAGLYIFWAGISFVTFFLMIIRPGWGTRIIAFPLVLLPFFYVFLFFSQNLPNGENDGWLAYYVRSHHDPAVLDIYNRIPDIVTSFYIPDQEMSNPLIFYMALCLGILFISAFFPKLKFLSGKAFPSKSKILRQLGLFTLVLIATFAYHIHQYDPMAYYSFLSPKDPIEQGSQAKKEYLYLATINDNLGSLIDGDRTVYYFKRDIEENANKISVLSVGSLRYTQSAIYLAQKMTDKNPEIDKLVQEYLDAMIAFYPFGREVERRARLTNADDLKFIKDNQQAYIEYLQKFKRLKYEISIALPSNFLSSVQNYRNSLAEDDKKQLYLTIFEDMLLLTVLADDALKLQLSTDGSHEFKNIAEKLRLDYNTWQQSFGLREKNIYEHTHESMGYFYKSLPNYLNLLNTSPLKDDDRVSLAIMRDGLMRSINLIYFYEYRWENSPKNQLN